MEKLSFLHEGLEENQFLFLNLRMLQKYCQNFDKKTKELI